MATNTTRANLLPALATLFAVVVLVAVGSIYAFHTDDETIQGEVEVKEYRVSSKLPGRILALRVKEGDAVRAGDTLAVLEVPEVEAKHKQALAAEAAAAAQRRKADGGARAEQIAAAFELVQKAKAGTAIAQKTFARIDRLYKEGVVTAQQHDEAEARRDAALATERAAQAQLDLARNGAQREDKEMAAATEQRAKGAVSEVDAYLREAVLTAAKEGEVTEIFPMEGELVGTGAPIMNVAVMRDVWVTFNVREDKLKRFAKGAEVAARIPALGDKAVRLRVYYLKDLGNYAAWKATKTTGQFDMKTFEVRARLVAPVEGLRAGMSVLAD